MATTTALLGITALAIAIEGWFRGKLPWWRRLLTFSGGMLLLIPDLPTDLLGLAISLASLGDRLAKLGATLWRHLKISPSQVRPP